MGERSSSWTARAREEIAERLPMENLLPDRQPYYVGSWVYVFGVVTIAALVLTVLSGVILAIAGSARQKEVQHMATEEAIKVQFTAQLRKSPAKGGWSYVIWPESAAFFETRGLVKVRGTIDGYPFRSAFMAMGGGVHKLPVKAETRQLLGKKAGDEVTVRLTARDRK